MNWESEPGMREVLDRLGWDQPRRESWQNVRCGYHDDTHASARVSVELGVYVCLACGLKAISPTALLMAAEGLTRPAAGLVMAGLGVDATQGPSGAPVARWRRSKARSFRQRWHR